jgi:hypothetical protein
MGWKEARLQAAKMKGKRIRYLKCINSIDSKESSWYSIV